VTTLAECPRKFGFALHTASRRCNQQPKAARELEPSGLWDELPGNPVPFIIQRSNAQGCRRFRLRPM
jgi:hypothetical protein